MWLKEIATVGFRNWFWFVVLLNRNEFHHSLSRASKDNYFKVLDKHNKRQKAHYIDLQLEQLKGK